MINEADVAKQLPLMIEEKSLERGNGRKDGKMEGSWERLRGRMKPDPEKCPPRISPT